MYIYIQHFREKRKSHDSKVASICFDLFFLFYAPQKLALCVRMRGGIISRNCFTANARMTKCKQEHTASRLSAKIVF